ncbi:MAG: serine/threonine-protein kinase [bacterium]
MRHPRRRGFDTRCWRVHESDDTSQRTLELKAPPPVKHHHDYSQHRQHKQGAQRSNERVDIHVLSRRGNERVARFSTGDHPFRTVVTSPIPDALFVAFQQAIIGRYSLECELGRGGMGVVYLAREVRLDRQVAIKLLPPEFSDNPELRERFMREARTAARLSHPYIVPVHAVEDIGGFVFIVMAYVDGGTLAQRVSTRGPLPPADVTRIMREVAWALAYAHAQGVVHRDIKPANILLDSGTGRAMVADFGIARLGASGGETAAGMVLGTPEFMSPEQASAEELDGRSDLYALGIVAYYALTGTLPFTGPAHAVLAKQLTQMATPSSSLARGAPRSLTDAIDRCLEKAPDARFATGEALADALEPGRDKMVEVPVPVRVFLDRRRMMAMIIPLGIAAANGTGMVTSFVIHGQSWAVPLVVAGGVLLGLGGPLAIVLYRLRRLLERGYGREDILLGLRRAFDRRREEFLYEFGAVPTRREKVFRVVSRTGLAVGALSLIALLVTRGAGAPVLAGGAIAGLYVGAITTVFSRKWNRLRHGSSSAWASLWSGPVGTRLMAMAGFRLRRRAVPADRPTELAIAMSAESIFTSLPRALRDEMGDVPAVLHELEAHARLARARIEEIDASIAEVQHGRGANVTGSAARHDALLADLGAQRSVADVRLGELVSALENVRLDLLRLRSGGGTVEGITRDIAAARRVGDEADRLIAGASEVDALLRRATPLPITDE